MEEVSGQEDPESKENGEPCWYVIQCKGGESFRAAEHLANQDYEVFHPVLDVQRKRQGKLTTITEPLFPYYLFIRLDQTVSNWRPSALHGASCGYLPSAIPPLRCPTHSSKLC